MLSKQDLEQTIKEIEKLPLNYQNCEKLATFYTIYDHLYTERPIKVEKSEENMIGDYGDSEFLAAIRGKVASDVWLLMDELMQAVQVTNPPLYDGVIRRL